MLIKTQIERCMSAHDALAFPQHGVNAVPNGVDEL